MRIQVQPTEAAVETHPNEPFEAVDTDFGVVQIGKPISCTSEVYNYLSQLTFEHSETGLATRYFDIDVLELDKPRPDFSQTAGAVLAEEVKLFQAVIAVVDAQLPSVKDKTAAYIAIYNATTNRVQGLINGQI